MTFSVVTTGGRALDIFIIPPLEKRGEGGLEKANKDRRDIDWLIIYKISPDPSLLKRGTKKGRLFSPFFHHTIRHRTRPELTNPYLYYKISRIYLGKEPEVKRYMVPRISHCKSGCPGRS